MPVATRKNTAAPSMRTVTVTDSATIKHNPEELYGKMILIDPNLVHSGPNTRAGKITSDNVADLAKELRKEQLQPIGVYPHPTKRGEFVTMYGNRRHQAGLINRNGETSLGVKGDPKFTLSAIVFTPPKDTDGGKLSSLEAITRTLNENRDREEVTPIDDAHAAVMLRDDYDLDNKEIANKLGCSAVWVGTLLELATVDPAIQTLVNEGMLPAKAAAETAGFTKAQVQAVVEAATTAYKAVTTKAKQAGKPPEAVTPTANKAAKNAGKGAVAEARAAGAGKAKGPQGRKPTAATAKTGADVAGIFKEMISKPLMTKADNAFFSMVAEFARGKATAASVQKCYYEARGLVTPPDVASAAQGGGKKVSA